MMSRLGAKYPVEIEVISKPVAEYGTKEYAASGLPAAPAVMVGKEIAAKGSGVSEEMIEAAICRSLGLPQPEPQKKGILGKTV
jgi:hypothetical protein